MKKSVTKRISQLYWVAPLMMGLIPFLVRIIYYPVGDDYVMNFIARGSFANQPDEYIPFVNIVIGKLLKGLYVVTGNKIDWMVVMYCICIIICTYIVLYVFYKYCSPLISLLFALTFEIISISWVTFTTISYISAFCGMIMMCELIKTDSLLLRRIKLTILVVVLLVFSYLVRTNAFCSVIVLSAPYVVFITGKKLFDNKKRVVITLLSIFVLIVVSSLFNNIVYSTEMWKEYHEWNKSRSLVFDYPIDEYSNNVYKSLNYSYNDYMGIKTKRYVADKNVYSANNLKEISMKTKESIRKNRNILQIFRMLINMKEYLWFLMIFALCCFVIEKKTYLFIQLLITQLLAIYLFYINRSLQRILVVLFFETALLMILAAFQRKKDIIDRVKYCSYVLVLIFMVLGLFSTKQIYKNMMDGKSADKEYGKVYKYIRSNGKYLFVMNGEKNLWKYYPATIFSRAPKFDNVESLCSYNLYSDIYYNHVKEYKLKHKERLLIDIVDNSNVLMVDWDNECANHIKKYLEEHTNSKIKMEKIKTFDEIQTSIYSVNYLE